MIRIALPFLHLDKERRIFRHTTTTEGIRAIVPAMASAIEETISSLDAEARLSETYFTGDVHHFAEITRKLPLLPSTHPSPS